MEKKEKFFRCTTYAFAPPTPLKSGFSDFPPTSLPPYLPTFLFKGGAFLRRVGLGGIESRAIECVSPKMIKSLYFMHRSSVTRLIVVTAAIALHIGLLNCRLKIL
jgi:hypothetical protein